MNLSDIPTPLTDAAERFSAIDYANNQDIHCVRADFARDLERKNAVLREALEKAVRAMEWYAWHKEEDHDCMEYRAVTAARAALTTTEEKV